MNVLENSSIIILRLKTNFNIPNQISTQPSVKLYSGLINMRAVFKFSMKMTGISLYMTIYSQQEIQLYEDIEKLQYILLLGTQISIKLVICIIVIILGPKCA